jgi:hypothetical protein
VTGPAEASPPPPVVVPVVAVSPPVAVIVYELDVTTVTANPAAVCNILEVKPSKGKTFRKHVISPVV